MTIEWKEMLERAERIWTHEGVECAVLKHDFYEMYNGYVQIPVDHPWHGLGYDDIDCSVHGGLTFGPVDGWIGFDTMHYDDMVTLEGPPFLVSNKTLDWVVEETERLAEQVSLAALVNDAIEKS